MIGAGLVLTACGSGQSARDTSRTAAGETRATDGVLEQLRQHNVEIRLEEQNFALLLVAWLPMVLGSLFLLLLIRYLRTRR